MADESILSLGRAIDYNPRRSCSFLTRGISLSGRVLDDWDRAVQDFGTALDEWKRADLAHDSHDLVPELELPPKSDCETAMHDLAEVEMDDRFTTIRFRPVLYLGAIMGSFCGNRAGAFEFLDKALNLSPEDDSFLEIRELVEDSLESRKDLLELNEDFRALKASGHSHYRKARIGGIAIYLVLLFAAVGIVFWLAFTKERMKEDR